MNARSFALLAAVIVALPIVAALLVRYGTVDRSQGERFESY